LLGGCATMDAGEPGILIDTAAHGQPLPGAACTAVIEGMHWEVVTPAVIAVGEARGELHVVCNHPGYRTSELIFRPASATSGLVLGFSGSGAGFGGGLGLPLSPTASRYPKRLTLDMNPP
jgi:hypothetical protein